MLLKHKENWWGGLCVWQRLSDVKIMCEMSASASWSLTERMTQASSVIIVTDRDNSAIKNHHHTFTYFIIGHYICVLLQDLFAVCETIILSNLKLWIVLIFLFLFLCFFKFICKKQKFRIWLLFVLVISNINLSICIKCVY